MRSPDKISIKNILFKRSMSKEQDNEIPIKLCVPISDPNGAVKMNDC